VQPATVSIAERAAQSERSFVFIADEFRSRGAAWPQLRENPTGKFDALM
jgi:hypothetical protein